MNQWVKVSVTYSDNPSLVPETYMVEGMKTSVACPLTGTCKVLVFTFLCKYMFVSGCNLQIALAWSRKPLSLSPNPAVSENLQQKKEDRKHSSTFLETTAASSPAATSKQPKSHLSIPAFDHTWAQMQLVADMSSPLDYNLYHLPFLVQLCGFSGLNLWDWRTHPRVALLK